MLKELQTKHRDIVRLSFQGFKPAEIAEKTGVSRTRVYAILKDPQAKAFLSGLNDQADKDVLTTREKLVSMESLAMDRAKEILGPKSKAPHASIVSLIKDVLDRNGYKAPEKYELDHKFSNSSDEEIDAKIAAAEEQIKDLDHVHKNTQSEKIKK